MLLLFSKPFCLFESSVKLQKRYGTIIVSPDRYNTENYAISGKKVFKVTKN